MWQDRHICVTGGAGFLGSFVVERLVASGARPDRIFVPRRRDFDLTRQADVERLFDTVQPDVMIHLAAEVGGIGANLANPGRYAYANLAMGLHLIEQARLHDVAKFVQIGTICAYPKHCPVPFSEDDLWNGYPEETNAPYGVAKKTLLTLCQAYREQYGLSAIYLLPVNLYGPRDNFDPETSHVIPAMIRGFLAARERGDDSVTLWGDGSPTREFLYVADAAEAIVAATLEYDDPAPVNLGTGRETCISELAGMIARQVGFSGRIDWDATRPSGQPRRCLDTRRAAERFGFVARTTLEEGLRRTIAWYTRTQNSAQGHQPVGA
jgi:GDP-L-fucose synthase